MQELTFLDEVGDSYETELGTESPDLVRKYFASGDSVENEEDIDSEDIGSENSTPTDEIINADVLADEAMLDPSAEPPIDTKTMEVS